MWAFLVIPYVTSTNLRIWVLPLAAGPVVGTPTAVERRSSAKRPRPDSEPAQEELVQPEVPAKGAPAPATPLPTPPSSGQARYDGPAIQRPSSAQTRLTFTEEAPVAEVEDAGEEARVVVTIQVVHDPTVGTHPAGTLRPPSLPPELRLPEHGLSAGASRQYQSVSGGEASSRSAAGRSHQGSAARETSKADDAAASLAVSAEATEHRVAGPASAAEAAAERLMAAARGKGQRPQRLLPTSAAVPASPFALPAKAEGLGAAPGAAGATAAAAATGKGEMGPSDLAPPAVTVHRAAPPPPPPPPPPAGAIRLCSAEDSVHAGLSVKSCVA